MASALRTFDEYMKRVKNRRNGIDEQPGKNEDDSDSEEEVEDERLRVKEEEPPDDVDMKVVRAVLLNNILFLTLELDEVENALKKRQQAEREAEVDNSDNSDYDKSSSEEDEEDDESQSNRIDPLAIHPRVRFLLF